MSSKHNGIKSAVQSVWMNYLQLGMWYPISLSLPTTGLNDIDMQMHVRRLTTLGQQWGILFNLRAVFPCGHPSEGCMPALGVARGKDIQRNRCDSLLCIVHCIVQGHKHFRRAGLVRGVA